MTNSGACGYTQPLLYMQGFHSRGKPGKLEYCKLGKLLEYCKPGKLLEFYVRPGIFGIISLFTHIKAKYSAYIFTTYFLQQVLTLIAFNYVW